jgi:hypothetical protein
MTIKALYPTVCPTLDLNFARLRRLDPRITYTRASTGTFVGSNGLIQTAASGVPRFDFNPTTGESLGLLVEEARTNLALNSEALNSWSNNGSAITVSANSQIAPDGNTTADVLSQSAIAVASRWISSNFVTYNTGISYTFSIWLKKISGSDAQPAIQFWAEGVGLQSVGAITTQWARYTATFSAASTSSNFAGLQIGWNDGGAANNFTFAAWGFQVEAGSFPTSYIPTTSSTATRATDVASLTGANFTSWYDQNGGTVFCQAISNSTENSSYWTLQGSASNGATLLVYPANSLTYQVQDAGVLQVNNVGFATYPSIRSLKTATVVRLNDFAVVSSGTTITTNLAGTVPPVTSFLIGKYLGGGGAYNYSGTIARIAYYPLRLSNAQLFALTQ